MSLRNGRATYRWKALIGEGKAEKEREREKRREASRRREGRELRRVWAQLRRARVADAALLNGTRPGLWEHRGAHAKARAELICIMLSPSPIAHWSEVVINVL